MTSDPIIYAAMGNSGLTVWALIGEGQLASVVVEGKIGTPDGKGNFLWELGMAEPFKNRSLTVDAVIQDVNPHTNRASVTFLIYQVAPGFDDVPNHRRNTEFFPSITLNLPENGQKSVRTLIR